MSMPASSVLSLPSKPGDITQITPGGPDSFAIAVPQHRPRHLPGELAPGIPSFAPPRNSNAGRTAALGRLGWFLSLQQRGTKVRLVVTAMLRVLQEQEFERLGGTRTVKVNVRLVAATHPDLEQMVANGQFRG